MSSPEHRPTAFLLHGLGGSARWWSAVIEAWGDQIDAVPIELPGFGAAPAALGVSVAEMADHVAQAIRDTGAARWILVGHSMGGKIASVVAARTMAGEEGLYGLAGVALLAGSPPTPEPMDEDRRAEMLAWAADGPLDEAAARDFVDANVGAPLEAGADAVAMEDLQRSSPLAWRAWLDRGSREDWSSDLGTLDLPALIIVGSEDEALGEEGQRATNLKVYPRAKLVRIEGAAHLLMLEKPEAVANAVLGFWNDAAGRGPAATRAYASLIASPRVGRRTRAALSARALADEAHYSPESFDPDQWAVLRALADTVVPQGEEGGSINLAARIDKQLALGKGDGWRFADLPADVQAYRQALDALQGFEALAPDQRIATLQNVAAGRFDPAGRNAEAGEARLNADQMKRWFEDARTDLARAWLAHPATMERIGFDGFANGGDAARKQGFQLLAADEHEAWEPLMEMKR